MMVTGALLDAVAHGAYHESGWFRASFALLVFLGVALSRARASLRKAHARDGDLEGALRRVERWGWSMCATVVLITGLMEVKPF